MKIWFIFVIILTLTLFSSSERIIFGETDRSTFLVEQDTFVDCFDHMPCTTVDNSKDNELKSSFYSGEQPFSWLNMTKNGVIEVTSSLKFYNDTSAIFLKFPINHTHSSNLFSDVTISEGELRFLALPIPKAEGDKGGYSGKLISSLFLCEKFYESKSPLQCEYGDEPIDSIIVNTEELPKFLFFDITPTLQKNIKSDSMELFVAIESKPIEHLKKMDIPSYQKKIQEHSQELFYYDYGYDYGYEYSSIMNAPVEGSSMSSGGETTIPEIFSKISNQPVFGFDVIFLEGKKVYLEIFTGLADFFIIPSSEHTSLSKPSIIVDYEILDSEFSKAFNYFLGLVLPAFAIIIPFVFWVIRKKNKEFPTNKLP